MPWEEVTVMSQKRKFIEASQQFSGSFKALCASFGITPKTGYKYLKKHRMDGLAGLNEQSRRPKTSPNKTPQNIEYIIIKVRLLHPTWGGEKLRGILKIKGIPIYLRRKR
jgi:transposase